MNRHSEIGNITLKNPFILAPMAGYTDAVYRKICSSMGASLTVAEMISAKGLCYGDTKSLKLAEILNPNDLTALQIFGSDPDIMARAAQKLEHLGNQLLDINMGCPVPKVVKNGDGSALLRNPELIYKIVKAVSSATDKPVTVKIRIGIDGASEDAHIAAAQAIESGGARAIAVHGRTREQYYSGETDISAIADVKNNVEIPVIGNGDIKTWHDAKNMIEKTKCDFIMIGRGALGNPWIFENIIAEWRGEQTKEPVTLEQRKEMIIRHFLSLKELKGEYVAVREMRKFVARYLKGIAGSAAIRANVNSVTNGTEFCELIRSSI